MKVTNKYYDKVRYAYKINSSTEKIERGNQHGGWVLHRNGFSVEDNPNTRISDEQYALLVKEFGKDLPEKDRNFAADRAQKEAPSVKEEKTAEIKTVIPKNSGLRS